VPRRYVGGACRWITAHHATVSDSLRYFQDQTKAPFAFQVVIEADYVAADCFAKPRGPLVVPAKTLLSQLL
jgi:hypothetical protein